MWGMKSRAIAALGAADPDVFASAAYARLHLEYPLCCPRCTLFRSSSRTASPRTPSCSAAWRSGSRALRRCGGCSAIACARRFSCRSSLRWRRAPAFFGQLATGYADVPVAMFVAAGVVASARWLLDDERAWLALTTLFVAAAALTKNEGLLFGAATYAALLDRGRRTASSRRSSRLCSSALVYAPWRASRRDPRSGSSGLRPLVVVQPALGRSADSIGCPQAARRAASAGRRTHSSSALLAALGRRSRSWRSSSSVRGRLGVLAGGFSAFSRSPV